MLVTGHAAGLITFHDPAGHTPEAGVATLAMPVFDRFAARRGVALTSDLRGGLVWSSAPGRARGPAQARHVGERDTALPGPDQAALAPAVERARDGGARGPGQAGQLVLGQRERDLDDALRLAAQPFGEAEQQPGEPLRAVGHRVDRSIASASRQRYA